MNERGNSVQRFFGVLLVAAGALIGGLSGLCTVLGVGAGIVGMFGHLQDGLSFIGLALAIGAIPIIVGIGLFVAGRALVRGADVPDGRGRLDDAP